MSHATKFAATVPTLLLLAASASAAPNPAAEAARADIKKTLGFAPQFLVKLPDAALPGAWDELKSLQLNPNTALTPKLKEMIGLAVASQVPCKYCIVAHTEFGKLGGAGEAEIGEAVTMAAITRHWSTFLNGIQTDDAKFRGEIKTIMDNVKRASAAGTPPPPPVNVVDGASALKDVNQTLGYVPEFIKRFPDVARSGAWRQMRDVQMSPKTALSAKEKELIGLAVASQVPCKFCIVAHTEFARLGGASEAEITEAIAMASLTRSMSTLLNGLQVDEVQFRRDVDKLVKGARAAAAAAQKPRTTAAR